MFDPSRQERPEPEQARDATRGPVPEPEGSDPTERPPQAPRELAPEPPDTRHFAVGEYEWLAWVSGKAAGGTGGYGLAMMVAIHFARVDAPDSPVFEALLPRGRFGGLYDEELSELLKHATPIVLPGAEQG